MTFAFGHLVGGWITGKVWKYFNRPLSKATFFTLLLGAVLPDIDLVPYFLLDIELHRTFTHSFLFAILLPLVVCFILSFLKKHYRLRIDPLMISCALSLGILTHLLLDTISIPGVPLLWPLNYYFGYFGILTITKSVMVEYPLSLLTDMNWIIFDMGIGTAWILYLILKGEMRI
jgi:membrane-bound metal-dependent hydrolase YbcI (DUF457 family)